MVGGAVVVSGVVMNGSVVVRILVVMYSSRHTHVSSCYSLHVLTSTSIIPVSLCGPNDTPPTSMPVVLCITYVILDSK